MKTNLLRTTLAALCFAGLAVDTAHAALIYSVTVLDTLGGSPSYAYGINASGQVAGESRSTANGAAHAVRGTGTTAQDLGAGYAYGINASGQAAGQTGGQAALWTGTAPMTLGALGGTSSAGLGINDLGQVVGWALTTGNLAQHATVWTGGAPQDLGTLGGQDSYAQAINISGQVAGWSDIGNGDYHAVRWAGTTPQDLGTLGGPNSAAYDINNSGQIVGFASITGNLALRATVWNGNTAIDLGTLGGTSSYAKGINDSGDVIGMSYLTGGTTYRAFLYTGGTMYDVNDLLQPGSGVTDLTVTDINGLDQIAAYGTINGETRALLLSPIPEPGTALVGVLLLGVATVRRRRSQA